MDINIFLQGIFHLKEATIPDICFSQARRCLIDYLGCALAGAKAYRDVEKDYISAFSGEKGCCSLIGYSSKVTVQTAALINGISAHAVELDDGHRIGMIHLGAPIISALLAVSEKESLSSRDLLYGIIVGYEAAIRLACSVQPECKLKGFHATGVCGTVGATLGICAALNLSYNQTKSAFSAAATSAAGLLEMIEGDTQLKPYNAGRAAMDAVVAAYIGKAGFRAPEDALSGRRGFLNAFSDGVHTTYLTDFSQNFFYINTIYNKLYASCRHTHPAIEAGIILRKAEGLHLSDVDSIVVETYKLAVSGHDHTEIKGVNSAKMSIPFSLAVALCKGKAGLDEFSDEMIADEDIRRLVKKISVIENAQLSALCPQKRAAIVTINTSGRSFVEQVYYPKGEPENPLSESEVAFKFKGLASYCGLTSLACDEVLKEVRKDVFSIRTLLALTTVDKM